MHMCLKHWTEDVLGRCLPERGLFKFLLLYYLREGPAHGYALMKRIANDFGRLYVPSPGVVYPTLQLLEDQGYVTCVEEDGKKKYALTPEGEKLIEEKEEVIKKIAEFRERRKKFGRVVSELWPSVKRLLRTIGMHLGELDEEKLERVREIVEKAADEVERVVAR